MCEGDPQEKLGQHGQVMVHVPNGVDDILHLFLYWSSCVRGAPTEKNYVDERPFRMDKHELSY